MAEISYEEKPFKLSKDGSIVGKLSENAQNEANFATTYYEYLDSTGTAINYHKALDFSNVGKYYEKPTYELSINIEDGHYEATAEGLADRYVPGKITKTEKKYQYTNDLALAFRQFHQTRIYVEGGNTFQGMNRHTKLEAVPNKMYVISANLPEQVNYSIGSQWQAPLAGLGGPLLSVMASLLKGGTSGTKLGEFLPDSFYNRFQTIQVWAGTSPLNMSITIPVIDDGSFNKDQPYEGKQNGVNTNLAEALEFLGSLCLPAYVARNGDTTKTRYGFYIPPPSPLSLTAKWYSYDSENTTTITTNKIVEDPKTHTSHYQTKEVPTAKEKTLPINVQNNARIMIQIGGMLLIDNCIITGVRVNYNNTKSLIRHHYDAEQNNEVELDYLTPQIASVTISFSTIEAITANDYGKMLWLRRQPDMGTGVVNAQEFQRVIQPEAVYPKQEQPQNT